MYGLKKFLNYQYDNPRGKLISTKNNKTRVNEGFIFVAF